MDNLTCENNFPGQQTRIDQNIQQSNFMTTSIKISEEFIRSIKFYDNKFFACSFEGIFIIDKNLNGFTQVINTSWLEHGCWQIHNNMLFNASSSTIRSWNLASSQECDSIKVTQLTKKDLNMVDFAIDKGKLCVLFDNDSVKIFDTKNFKKLKTTNGLVNIFDIKKLKTLDCSEDEYEGDFEMETHLLRVQEGKLVVAVTNVFTVFDLTNYKEIGKFVEKADYITCFQVHENKLYSGSISDEYPRITIWDLENQTKINQVFENFHNIEHQISSMQIYDNKLFCEFTDYANYGLISIWDLTTHKQMARLEEEGCITCFHYQDGRLFSALSREDSNEKTLILRNFDI
ncbi:MAG: hypothetical protein JSR80_01570 [Verrucomicrobia bacterium]|nr:hypothetical protein [Verrucomicrobiota bacterium]